MGVLCVRLYFFLLSSSQCFQHLYALLLRYSYQYESYEYNQDNPFVFIQKIDRLIIENSVVGASFRIKPFIDESGIIEGGVCFFRFIKRDVTRFFPVENVIGCFQ